MQLALISFLIHEYCNCSASKIISRPLNTYKRQIFLEINKNEEGKQIFSPANLKKGTLKTLNAVAYKKLKQIKMYKTEKGDIGLIYTHRNKREIFLFISICFYKGDDSALNFINLSLTV